MTLGLPDAAFAGEQWGYWYATPPSVVSRLSNLVAGAQERGRCARVTS